ncbi:tetratricopeptide repeat protein 19, mitochondrial isoform X2 [Alligator mississippiensis]|uniref:tetratricopeptide repeat protein 19, mitochondrial isoform X2 n=1 Tax=Alligator mississippiensis TaxID=8496 RepID=UPI002877BF11|nr:tetratricopeptide repeat protein 19, mitochondrial isoform X2 [Alligator mississippiensis]
MHAGKHQPARPPPGRNACREAPLPWARKARRDSAAAYLPSGGAAAAGSARCIPPARHHSNRPRHPGGGHFRLHRAGGDVRRHVLPLLKGQRGAMLAALPRALARLAAAAGRRCPRAGAAVTWAAGRGRGARRGAPGLGLGLLAAFPLFSEDAGEAGAGAEDAVIILLKEAKLRVAAGDLEEAERLLHRAAHLAQQSEHRQAVVYTYAMAEKLFKAVISLLLAGDTKQDDNAIIEMSLKLASIYAAQNQDQQAITGYKFCILTLEEKTATQKDLPEDVLPAKEKANTRLLLGLCLDSYGRYLLTRNQPAVAQIMYEKALQISRDIQGETHPQTLILMSDLATALDVQGRYDEAYTYVKRAAELAKQTKHPEEHVVLNNLAGILMHKEDFVQAERVYEAALKQARQKGDDASVQHIQKELANLATRRKAQTP